ncbi:hypothetical protein OO015_11655 [Thermomicrobium sp. 4228-Ro]|uniref:DnaA N-terminal domain-containing protein n=1 Tax=Thermomicrobium sp. 4228-Ro TaxID=2993937 RepID=UPI002248AD9D|nr:DnaA N-terminal domain-containing protein [Thermomicrobium sp. 4228-Ro]MCX2728145.1 hypothetical protein [Thermomicrobium sp. 4228-Ro]
MADPPAEANAQPERSGEDSRRRGWFWHWNTIITQFAPLIGLKGVGLLNSYTVWTDRRENSPYRGYAFPSQHAEAAFYGEDRGELITINKILVALDLIEIRKEMVTRTDEAGRRWRVPHNFYRVKDRPEGFVLTPEAVLRVIELAERDEAVYRYIRHIFSSRFAPIDRENVWHQILPVVRRHPLWQKLAARAAAEDARFSARTRAGHARRKAAAVDGSPADPTSVGGSDSGSVTDVGLSNDGSPTVVATSDSGFPLGDLTTVGPSNREEASSVAPFDTTYDQVVATTTTTADLTGEAPPADAAGPVLEPSPEVVACYEAANARPASPLERSLLAELEREFVLLAAARGERPAEVVVAAIREAVASGSRYVAPKRVREILARWSRHAVRSSSGPPRELNARAAPPLPPASADARVPLEGLLAPETLDRLVSLLEEAMAARLARAIPVEVESTGGPTASSLPQPPAGLAPLWSLAQEHLSERLPPAVFAECIRPARLLAVLSSGEVVLGVPNASVRRTLERRWLSQLEDVLATLLARPVQVRIVTFAEWGESHASPS